MKEKEIDELFAALDKVFSSLGYARFEDAISSFLKWAEETSAQLRLIQDREGLREQLRTAGEPAPITVADATARVSPALDALRLGLTYVLGSERGARPKDFHDIVKKLPSLAYVFRPRMIAEAKRLPHAPGGRPYAKARRKRKQICSQIAGLHAAGVPLKTAFTRIALRHNASATTIQRIWRDRKGGSDA